MRIYSATINKYSVYWKHLKKNRSKEKTVNRDETQCSVLWMSDKWIARHKKNQKETKSVNVMIAKASRNWEERWNGILVVAQTRAWESIIPFSVEKWIRTRRLIERMNVHDLVILLWSVESIFHALVNSSVHPCIVFVSTVSSQQRLNT